MNTKIKIYTEEDMRYNLNQLKRYGYSKIADCMWIVIYKKGNSEVTLVREY